MSFYVLNQVNSIINKVDMSAKGYTNQKICMNSLLSRFKEL
jgi:hypothetical protein